MIVDFVKQNPDIMDGNSHDKEKNKEYWETLSNALNNEGPIVKSADKWKKVLAF